MIVVALLGAIAPAFRDYYIIREGAVGPCKVVGQRPSDTKVIVGGPGRSYASKAVAEKELPQLCRSK